MQNNPQTHEITINITLSRQFVVVLIITMLAITAAAWFLWDSRPAQASSPDEPIAESSTTGMRRYYLTATSIWEGDDPADPGICEDGFHFASLWELLDLSNLEYYIGSDSDILSDQGSGPPTSRGGWVRTGYGPDAWVTPGQANCNVWTSPSEFDYGTRAMIPAVWNPSEQDVHTWQVWTESCNDDSAVWCIED